MPEDRNSYRKAHDHGALIAISTRQHDDAWIAMLWNEPVI
jgi:hypothetical protein